jgi:hypothetical protein
MAMSYRFVDARSKVKRRMMNILKYTTVVNVREDHDTGRAPENIRKEGNRTRGIIQTNSTNNDRDLSTIMSDECMNSSSYNTKRRKESIMGISPSFAIY